VEWITLDVILTSVKISVAIKPTKADNLRYFASPLLKTRTNRPMVYKSK
jgi:hypothetical protein